MAGATLARVASIDRLWQGATLRRSPGIALQQPSKAVGSHLVQSTGWPGQSRAPSPSCQTVRPTSCQRHPSQMFLADLYAASGPGLGYFLRALSLGGRSQS